MSAKLELSKATKDSCKFKVSLSNAFNSNYYKALVITDEYYGRQTDDIHHYLKKVIARGGSSRYVKGEVKGLRADRKYKLCAYAQTINGTWYFAGDDTIMIEQSEIDLRIVGVYYKQNGGSYERLRDRDVFERGMEYKFKVVIENNDNFDSPDYEVLVEDHRGNELYSKIDHVRAKRTENTYLYVDMDSTIIDRLTFKVELKDRDLELRRRVEETFDIRVV